MLATAAPGASAGLLSSTTDTQDLHPVDVIVQQWDGEDAGVAALLLEADPTATNDRVKFALMHTARPTHAPAEVGAGVIDIAAALAAPAGEANGDLFHPLLLPLADPTDADLAGSVFDGLASVWQTVEWEGRNWQGRSWQSELWS